METEARGVLEEPPVGMGVIESEHETDIAENDYVAVIYSQTCLSPSI